MLFAFVVATGLIAYNTVTNLRWPGDRWYVPRNVVLGAALLAVGHGRGLTWEQLGVGPDALAIGLRWARGVVLGVVVVLAAALALAPRSRLVRRLLADRRADVSDRALAWQTLVRIPVGTAAFEEIAFRGVLLALLLDVTSTVMAVAISAVAFGLWHVGPTLAALDVNDTERDRVRAVLGAVTVTAAAGVAFAWLRLESSLFAVIIVHWAVNAFGLLSAAAHQRS